MIFTGKIVYFLIKILLFNQKIIILLGLKSDFESSIFTRTVTLIFGICE